MRPHVLEQVRDRPPPPPRHHGQRPPPRVGADVVLRPAAGEQVPHDEGGAEDVGALGVGGDGQGRLHLGRAVARGAGVGAVQGGAALGAGDALGEAEVGELQVGAGGGEELAESLNLFLAAVQLSLMRRMPSFK